VESPDRTFTDPCFSIFDEMTLLLIVYMRGYSRQPERFASRVDPDDEDEEKVEGAKLCETAMTVSHVAKDQNSQER